ncbi:C45 family autoproteolytic acyltransferase/hydolase [Paenalcaligenes sp. Me131]|uniref:C45 family autoproteolytic acyltransferase/hydolase n=1 Tax=Paenalcaligenes sp. Me131 TaxID=3392636 RepID=UPI003D2852E6
MSSLHYLPINGSHYEIGVQLGQFGASVVHQKLLKSDTWMQLRQWLGSTELQHMKAQVQSLFPTIWQEIEGLSVGLQLSVEETFMWNCRGDLWAMAPDGCTTVQQATPRHRRITHNEDGDPSFYGHCAIVHVTPKDDTAFVSFAYPGSIPGHTFATNAHQLVMTVNNIRSLDAKPGIPRMVLCRAILSQPSVEAAIRLLRHQARSGAFHLSLCDAHSAIHSVEFNRADVSVQTIEHLGFHANHAIHTAQRDYPQIITGSSGYRQVQGEYLLQHARTQPNSTVDALAILGSHEHDTYPIYRRTPHDPDNENTMATADFLFEGQNLRWSVYDSPSRVPLFSFIGLQRNLQI